VKQLFEKAELLKNLEGVSFGQQPLDGGSQGYTQLLNALQHNQSDRYD
jgi:hypothetical protein